MIYHCIVIPRFDILLINLPLHSNAVLHIPKTFNNIIDNIIIDYLL